MKDEKLDPRIRELAGEYNSPPPVPRERIWKQIEARRRQKTAPGPAGAIYRFMWWSMATAAVLALGIAIGRWSPQMDGTRTVEHAPRATTTAPEYSMQPASTHSDRRRQKMFTFAAVPVLGQAETLLTEYRTNAPDTTTNTTYTHRARKLLNDTRLLLDSPAAQDPQLGLLLSDLELVLAQIVHIAGESRIEDQEWIAAGITRNALLSRLRNQMSGPAKHI